MRRTVYLSLIVHRIGVLWYMVGIHIVVYHWYGFFEIIRYFILGTGLILFGKIIITFPLSITKLVGITFSCSNFPYCIRTYLYFYINVRYVCQ